MTERPRRCTVAVAGASGFVGRALVDRLLEDHDVVALGRSAADGESWRGTTATGRRCDLFSLKDAERALHGCDVAVYLVHSMMPSARLTQSSFADMDAILADNFGRAAAHAGVQQILYLGGLVADGESLSPHLRSRAEVERLLGAHGVPVTTLRAGLVVGAGGSSFRILRRLVERLPLLICPRWTRTLTQPIALVDVVEALARCVDASDVIGGTYDVGGPDVLSYRDMIARTARALGLKRRIVDAPVLTPRLSTLWVSTVTGTTLDLVGPLVRSLRHDMVARDSRLLQQLGIVPIGFEDAVRDAVARDRELRAVQASSSGSAGSTALVVRRPADVRSIQRLPRPPDMDAPTVTRRYLEWLPRFCRPWLRVRVSDEGVCRFEVALVNVCLLELSWSHERSSADRTLLYITDGLLAQVGPEDRDRLEFRVLPDGRSVLAAIHDFTPALPWFLYVVTQAQAHLIVMRAFARHLRREGRPRPLRPTDVPTLADRSV